MNIDSFKHIEFNRLFSLCEDVGKSLDEGKLRFDKADLFEAALESCSGGKFKWEDGKGFDHICLVGGKDEGLLIEMKSQRFCLHTPLGAEKKKTKSIKLNNTQGTSKKMQKTFDRLLIVDTGSRESYSAAVVSYETVEKHYKNLDDGNVVQIPNEELFWVVKPKDIKLKQTKTKLGAKYRQRKRELQLEVINAYKA